MATCNGCTLEILKKKYGKKLIKVEESWYLKNEKPAQGQSEPMKLEDGTPIQFVIWFMDEGHCH